MDADSADQLRLAYPWPPEEPRWADHVQGPDAPGERSHEALALALSDLTKIVVQLGVRSGWPARSILENAPNATVISVDPWEESPEHRAPDDLGSEPATPHETFLSLNWRDRDRIILLRMSTLEGLGTVARFGIAPDVICMSAEHGYRAITSELELAHKLFPRARVIGNHFSSDEVRNALENFTRRHGLGVERIGATGWSIVERRAALAGIVSADARSRAVVLVPHLSGIDAPCEQGLRDLELAGIRVLRRQGSSQIDLARNEMLSTALHDGFETMLFIDADIGFDAADAMRLLARPEPVVSAVYAKKGPREVGSVFQDGIKNILFGPEAPGLYPLRYAATGFLRIRAEVLRLMIDRLKLPLCNTKWGPGFWPFFMTVILRQPDGHLHYLGEDWSFSHRLHEIGVTPMADTSIRLFHFGPYGYSWEDVGSERPRYRSYNLSID